MLDHETFEVKGAWEKNRVPQELSYNLWWHLATTRMITSEWGTLWAGALILTAALTPLL